ncbi:hypothetical protein ROZALSC1DRAFT_30795 [Rozella allomycis CSF55]|uniref:DNA/RNA-binding protein Kin17 WH-like domain-containing protein n=1 Tax=Rozella allomycis (strain CSF55) TaxID=988480 RepID=A0A4P9YGE5_ROZAC|nr:hypothetical protein ROZALSC1DRAFT_30795 [Rozella allomycis CSF55]
MPKAEAGTSKALANKMKSKGLQKLRWYCQVCEKQCRDENGFKCHVLSEAHQRQMKLFGGNVDKQVNSYSREFSSGFISLLSRQYGTRRVHANHVYQEYIRDKQHTHMNATRWHSLTDFVLWLGKERICNIEETERGWFITWIDNSPEALAKRELQEHKAKVELDAGRIQEILINRQIEKAKEKARELNLNLEFKEEEKVLERENQEEIIKLDFKAIKSGIESKSALKPLKTIFDEDEESEKEEVNESKRRNVFGEIKEKEENKKMKKEKETVLENWLHPNIWVKVLNKELEDGKFYKKKGIVVKVIDRFIAQIEIEDERGKVMIRIDQDELETVIPAIGKKVLIVNGERRGSVGILEEIDFERYNATIKLSNGVLLKKIPYEYFSKSI